MFSTIGRKLLCRRSVGRNGRWLWSKNAMRQNPTSRKPLRMNLAISDSVGNPRQGTDSPQGFVSPASRRSLAVHNPCSLPGGDARDLQPNVFPTMQESTQARGESRARDENRELLRAIANSKVFTEFGRAFTGATGLPVALRPVQFFQLP